MHTACQNDIKARSNCGYPYYPMHYRLYPEVNLVVKDQCIKVIKSQRETYVGARTRIILNPLPQVNSTTTKRTVQQPSAHRLLFPATSKV